MGKLKIFVLISLLLFLLPSLSNAASFASGSTGTDGAFNPTTNITVQLPANGILNYTTVNIPAGVTVTFKKNAANTPVYILATGDVTIAGTIKLDGAAGSFIQPGAGGPNGFDGGYGGTQNSSGGKGLGPGGGNPGIPNSSYGGGGGGFGTNGSNSNGNTAGGAAYGNSVLLPLMGGSGGGGSCGSSINTGGAGGGGGGALLIASSGTLNVTGTITANGGTGANAPAECSYNAGGGGSGGAIKLMANTIAGNGTISAVGGNAGLYLLCSWGSPTAAWASAAASGGDGRVRLEANTLSRTAGTTPVYTYDYPGPVFVANIPSLQITSVGGVSVPSAPTGSYATPDITLPSTTANPVAVTLSASNIPAGTTVTVSMIPQFGSATNVNVTLSGATATASVNLSTMYPYIITATATFTVQTAMNYNGEKIEKVRVASTMGKGSEVTYITESGKEIPAEALFASLLK